MEALKVANLFKTYRAVEAVRGISFEVHPGEIFALVGPNGAGKSTTLKITATILSPSSGDVEIFGRRADRHSAQVREIISYLPEEAGAYKNLTGLQYLEFMAAVFFEDPAKQAASTAFARDIAGLGARLEDKIKTYSKGMLRKLLLARAVMTRPKLAILDEPTSGLDILNAFEIRKMLKGLAKEGMSILLSSHNMLEIEFLADRVAIINNGMIIENGMVSEIKGRHAAANLEEVFAKIVL